MENKGKGKTATDQAVGATTQLDEPVLPIDQFNRLMAVLEQQQKQIAELLEKYPDVFYIWNDGLDPAIIPSAEATDFFRAQRPGIHPADRRHGRAGDPENVDGPFHAVGDQRQGARTIDRDAGRSLAGGQGGDHLRR